MQSIACASPEPAQTEPRRKPSNGTKLGLAPSFEVPAPLSFRQATNRHGSARTD